MSVPLIIGVLVFLAVVGAVAGVWRSRRAGAAGTQSSLMMLVVVIVAALLVLFLFRGHLE
jgi:uncharacterized membrane protein YeaQ/YmgE (transglycosylase-associated protein family)